MQSVVRCVSTESSRFSAEFNSSMQDLVLPEIFKYLTRRIMGHVGGERVNLSLSALKLPCRAPYSDAPVTLFWAKWWTKNEPCHLQNHLATTDMKQIKISKRTNWILKCQAEIKIFVCINRVRGWVCISAFCTYFFLFLGTLKLLVKLLLLSSCMQNVRVARSWLKL